MYSEQLNEGDGYDNIQKCIQVSILNHVLISEDDKILFVELHFVIHKPEKNTPT